MFFHVNTRKGCVVLTNSSVKHSFKRDVRKAREEEDWKKTTRDRGEWKRLSDEAVEL